MIKPSSLRVAALIASLATPWSVVDGVFAKSCEQYMGKGYCTDYIQSRLRRKQRGDAGSWVANVDKRNIRVNDVVIFSKPSPWGHVALIDQLLPGSKIQISEWNYGNQWKDRPCAVTNMFRTVSTRVISLDDKAIKGFWR